MSTTQAPHVKTPLGKVLIRRTALAGALMAIILIPSLILVAATGQPAASYAALGTIVGAVAVMAAGVRIGVITAVVLALLAPLSIVAGLTPVTGAALMALMTLVVGRMSRFGLHRAVMLVPIMIAWPMLSPVPWIPTALLAKVNAVLSTHGMSLAHALEKADPTQSASGPVSSVMSDALLHQRLDTTYLAWVAVFMFIGAIVPVILLPVLTRKRPPSPKPAPETHSQSESLVYTVTITVLTAAGTYYFIDHPKQIAGSFFIATVLVLTQVGAEVQWRLTIERVLGTMAGVVLMIFVSGVAGGSTYVELVGLPVPISLYLIGIVFGTLAIIAKFSTRQWIYFLLMAPTTACLNAFSFDQANDLGEQRLGDNLVGAGLVILAALITLAASRIAQRHSMSSGDTSIQAA